MKKNKCVIVLDKDLPVGLSANTAAVLGMGLSHAAPEIMGSVLTDAAQSTKDYAAYEEKLKQTAPGQLRYLGIGLFGPEKLINSLTGSLPMLR
jgi:hypothetical protein